MPGKSFESRLREAANRMGASAHPQSVAEGNAGGPGLVDSSLLEYVASNPYVPPSLDKEVQLLSEQNCCQARNVTAT